MLFNNYINVILLVVRNTDFRFRDMKGQPARKSGKIFLDLSRMSNSEHDVRPGGSTKPHLSLKKKVVVIVDSKSGS